MKSFQTIVLVVFALFALLGLFLFATFSGSGGGAPVGPVLIWGTLPESAVLTGVDTLKLTNKEYNQVSYVEMEPEALETSLAEAIASGAGPDLVIITQEQILSQASKLSVIPFTSISERSFVSSYTQINELYLTTDGFYGLPIVVDPLVLYYNRPLLAAAGIAEPPTTWEAVTGIVEHLTKRQIDQNITQSGIAFGEYGNVTNARAIVSLLFLQSGSPITEKTTTGVASVLSGNADSGGNTPAVAAINFYTQFVNPVKTVYSWNRSLPASRQSFLTGDLALYVGFASERAYFTEANPNLDFDMAAIPQPGTTEAPKTYGQAYAFAIPRASANFEGAFRTAVALTFPAPMQSIAEDASMAPARRTLLVSAPDRYAEIFYPAALTATGWLSPAPRSVDTIFSAMIESITTGRRDITTALLSAHQSLQAALP